MFAKVKPATLSPPRGTRGGERTTPRRYTAVKWKEKKTREKKKNQKRCIDPGCVANGLVAVSGGRGKSGSRSGTGTACRSSWAKPTTTESPAKSDSYTNMRRVHRRWWLELALSPAKRAGERE